MKKNIAGTDFEYLVVRDSAGKEMFKTKSVNKAADFKSGKKDYSVYGIGKDHTGFGKKIMAKGGVSGRHRKKSLEERAEEMVGSVTWHSLDKKTQAGLISEMIMDGTMPQMMAGGAVVKSSFSATFTLMNGTKVTEKYESKEDMDEGIANFYMENDVEDVEITEKDLKKILEEEEKLTGERAGEKKAGMDKPKAKSSLFDMAKKSEPKGKAKGKDKPEVRVSGIEDEIARYDELKAIINNAKAEQELIGGRLKEVGKDKYLELYEENRRRPDNFNLADGDKDILFMVTDKYKLVSPEKEAILEEYPDLLGIDVTYKFDNDTLEKTGTNGERIGDIINDLIMNTEDISEADKRNLLKVEKKVAIKKGSIDRLLDYDNPTEIFNLIEPILALK